MSEFEWPEGTEALLDEILSDAYGYDEQLWAIRQALEYNVKVPADAFVIGEPVELVAIDYDGNTRRGLTAKCRRQDGGEHVVAASEVVFPDGSVGAMHVAAYRRWLGLDPALHRPPPPTRRTRRHKAARKTSISVRPSNSSCSRPKSELLGAASSVPSARSPCVRGTCGTWSPARS